MMTFVLAAVVLVDAVWVAAALDGITTEAPPGVVASHVSKPAELVNERVNIFGD